MGMMSMLMGAKGAGVVNPLPGGTSTAGAPSAANIQFNADGTVSFSPSGATHNWYSPTTTGIGGSYYVKFTKSSGDNLTTNQASTWTSLSGAKYFSYSPGSYKTADVLVEISADASGTPVVASGTYTITQAS